MFGKTNPSTNHPVVLEMNATQERFSLFIDKLMEKLREFAEASLPELTTMNASDDDEFKRSYHRMKSAVVGQLETIIKKAREVREEKITNFPYAQDDEVACCAYYPFRTCCYEKYNVLEEMHQHYLKRIEQTSAEDFEVKYQKILDEYQANRDKFNCSQCGCPLTMDKIYFTTTYITCPACSTRNTYEPSTQAKMLEHIGRSLAEQRTRHLLDDYNELNEKPHQLYLQQHTLKLSLIHEQDARVIAEKERQILELEQERADIDRKAPEMYKQYLRAMFDEWNTINPDLSEEHERFYLRLLKDYQNQKTIENEQ